MKGLFRLKRISYKLVSKLFYILFFVAGFFTAMLVKNANLVDMIKDVLK